MTYNVLNCHALWLDETPDMRNFYPSPDFGHDCTELHLSGPFLHCVRELNPFMRSIEHVDQVSCPLRI